MKFRVYKHIVIEEQFIGAFSQTMDAAIFIGAYYKQYPTLPSTSGPTATYATSTAAGTSTRSTPSSSK